MFHRLNSRHPLVLLICFYVSGFVSRAVFLHAPSVSVFLPMQFDNLLCNGRWQARPERKGGENKTAAVNERQTARNREWNEGTETNFSDIFHSRIWCLEAYTLLYKRREKMWSRNRWKVLVPGDKWLYFYFSVLLARKQSISCKSVGVNAVEPQLR